MIHVLSRPVITSSYHQYYNAKLPTELVIFLVVVMLILIIDRLRNNNTEDDNRENDK